MKLEVRKLYLNNNGLIVGPLKEVVNPTSLRMFCDEKGSYYSKDGKFTGDYQYIWSNPLYDLVSEYVNIGNNVEYPVKNTTKVVEGYDARLGVVPCTEKTVDICFDYKPGYGSGWTNFSSHELRKTANLMLEIADTLDENNV